MPAANLHTLKTLEGDYFSSCCWIGVQCCSSAGHSPFTPRISLPEMTWVTKVQRFTTFETVGVLGGDVPWTVNAVEHPFIALQHTLGITEDLLNQC